MAEKVEKLVRMANQIAIFFRPYSDAEAVAGIQEHIRSFWTRGMREELVATANAGELPLDPRVAAAVDRLRAPGLSPIHQAAAGAEEMGEAASDAG